MPTKHQRSKAPMMPEIFHSNIQKKHWPNNAMQYSQLCYVWLCAVQKSIWIKVYSVIFIFFLFICCHFSLFIFVFHHICVRACVCVWVLLLRVLGVWYLLYAPLSSWIHGNVLFVPAESGPSIDLFNFPPWNSFCCYRNCEYPKRIIISTTRSIAMFQISVYDIWIRTIFFLLSIVYCSMTKMERP